MQRSVNLIVLNYNGKGLIEKYLSSVIEAAKRSSHRCRVSVIDNKSTDGSTSFIKEHFKDITLYDSPENRLLFSYNEYLKEIDDEIVIFLNSDIRLDPYFVDPLIKYFNDKNVLFVAPKELDMAGAYRGNLSKLVFRLGVLSSMVEKTGYETVQCTASVHSGAFDRLKFLELGGYDDLYFPGIVEDLDLCYRGWKRGWKGIYEPKSFYYHEGSTSFNAKYGSKRRETLAHRNKFLFFWKNITSKRLIFLHITQLPFLLLAALIRGRWLIVRAFFQASVKMNGALKRRSSVVSDFFLSDEEAIKRIESPY